jgi:hypothetical protein
MKVEFQNTVCKLLNFSLSHTHNRLLTCFLQKFLPIPNCFLVLFFTSLFCIVFKERIPFSLFAAFQIWIENDRSRWEGGEEENERRLSTDKITSFYLLPASVCASKCLYTLIFFFYFSSVVHLRTTHWRTRPLSIEATCYFF